ncbi:MAG: hypothetical protein V2B17_06310 [Chloroflexota bacterium]
MLGRMTSGPTNEEEARVKEAARAGEREHVALEAVAGEAAMAGEASAGTPPRPCFATPAPAEPGLAGRIRRLFRRT